MRFAAAALFRERRRQVCILLRDGQHAGYGPGPLLKNRFLCGASVWGHRLFNGAKRRFLARAGHRRGGAVRGRARRAPHVQGAPGAWRCRVRNAPEVRRRCGVGRDHSHGARRQGRQAEGRRPHVRTDASLPSPTPLRLPTVCDAPVLSLCWLAHMCSWAVGKTFPQTPHPALAGGCVVPNGRCASHHHAWASLGQFSSVL